MSQIGTKGLEGIYELDKDVAHNFAMTFTLDIETWVKVTGHPLPKGILWVKCEPDWIKGEKKNAPNSLELCQLQVFWTKCSSIYKFKYMYGHKNQLYTKGIYSTLLRWLGINSS